MHIPANALNKRDLGLEAEIPSFSKKTGKKSGAAVVLDDRWYR